MSEVYQLDDSIHEPSTAHIHPLETTPQGSQADSAEGEHEHRDVSFGALGKWLTGLFVGIIASFLLMILFFNWAVKAAAVDDDEAPSAMFAQRPNLERSWPMPRHESPLQGVDEVPTLLPEPEEPMKELRREEIETLEMYDRQKDENGKPTGGITIPIERAIDLTAERGLPADNKTNLRPPVGYAEIARPGAKR